MTVKVWDPKEKDERPILSCTTFGTLFQLPTSDRWLLLTDEHFKGSPDALCIDIKTGRIVQVPFLERVRAFPDAVIDPKEQR